MKTYIFLSLLIFFIVIKIEAQSDTTFDWGSSYTIDGSNLSQGSLTLPTSMGSTSDMEASNAMPSGPILPQGSNVPANVTPTSNLVPTAIADISPSITDNTTPAAVVIPTDNTTPAAIVIPTVPSKMPSKYDHNAIVIPTDNTTPAAVVIPTVPGNSKMPSKYDPNAIIIPADNTTPAAIVIPTDNTTPAAIVIPTDNTTPAAIVIPTDNTTPAAVVIPTDNTTPAAIVIPSDNTTPATIVIPTVPGNSKMPSKYDPNAIVIPTDNTIPTIDNTTPIADNTIPLPSYVSSAYSLVEPAGQSYEPVDGGQGPLAAQDFKQQNNRRLPQSCYRKGMTWVKNFPPSHDCTTFVDKIGCSGPVKTDLGSYSCNPYSGDTYCYQYRRVLCHNPHIRLNRPSYPIYSVSGSKPSAFYQGWTGSFIRETPPVRGCSFADTAAVNKFCQQNFGCGWRVMEFHDGFWIPGMSANSYFGNNWNWSLVKTGGWNVRGYGNVPSNVRYWVNISTTNANCWNH